MCLWLGRHLGAFENRSVRECARVTCACVRACVGCVNAVFVNLRVCTCISMVPRGQSFCQKPRTFDNL